MSLAAAHAPVTPVVPPNEPLGDATPVPGTTVAMRLAPSSVNTTMLPPERVAATWPPESASVVAVGESDDRKLGSIVTSGFDEKLRSSRPGRAPQAERARTICPSVPFITRPTPSVSSELAQRPLSSGRVAARAPPAGSMGSTVTRALAPFGSISR